VSRILDLELARLHQRLAAREVALTLSADARQFLIDQGYDPAMGARPLRRAVQQYMEDPLAELLLRGGLNRDTEISVRPSDAGDRLVFDGAVRAAEGATS